VRGWTARLGRGADEKTLVGRARRGDADAFGTLVRGHQDAIYRLCARLVGPDDAEDVAQRAFLKAWQGLSGYQGNAAFGTWLYRIATNLCLDDLRQAGRFRPRPIEDADSVAADDDVAEAVESAQETAARREALGWALDQLPSEEKLLLSMRVGEGMPYAEIAEALGLNPRTVGTRLFRARARLRDLVRRRLGEGDDGLR